MSELNKREDRRAPLAAKNASLSKLLACRKKVTVMPPCFQVASLACSASLTQNLHRVAAMMLERVPSKVYTTVGPKSLPHRYPQ